MPAINGKQYLDRMDQLHPNVWIKGEKISEKLSQHPVYKGAIATKASLYDTQVQPDLITKMTYFSPTSNERVGLSFLQPVTKEDLEARRFMIKTWAKKTAGMMGRTPDYLSTVFMTFASSATLLREQDDEFYKNLVKAYENARENDFSFTHSFINPQINRSTNYADLSSKPIAAKITKKTADGLIIEGARMLATQGGMTDEVFILPTGQTEEYAFCFSIPTDTEGLKFICRESYYQDDSSFNYPLSSRFDEMDTMIVFDHVLVPWDRVFFYHRQDLAHKLFSRSSFTPHTLHQVIIRQITKIEFMIGLAQKLVSILNVSEYHHIQEKISEMIIGLETMKALLDRSELEAKVDEWGTMVPYSHSLFVASNLFPKLYPRLVEIIQLIGAGGMVAIPSEEDFSSRIATEIGHFCQGTACNAETKAKVFRLAWDLTMTSFGTRQTQYERYFFGDPARLSSTLYNGYPRDEYIYRIDEFLDIDKEAP